MNKQDIKFCPWEPCGVELKAENIAAIVTNVNGEFMPASYITCNFCGGQYLISEHKAPMSKEEVENKWFGIPLTDKKAVRAAKRNTKK